MDAKPISPTALKLIRASLLAGVLALGAVAWILHRTEGRATMGPEQLSSFRIAFVVVTVLEATFLQVVRSRRTQAADFQSAAVASIIGWALGESVALLGGVIYLLSADPTLFLLGLLFLLVTFVIVPMPRPDEERSSISL